MPEDPYAYVVAAFQALPEPDYVPGPEELEQAPPSPVYIPYVPEPEYSEYIPVEDEVFPAEEQPLPAAASPTTDLPGYIPESDPDEDPEDDDDDEDPEENPADYPTDHDDDDEMRRRSTQLRPTLFHLHLHFVSRLGYLLNPSHRHCPSLRRMLRASPPILPIPLPTVLPPLQLLSSDRKADRPEVTLPPRKRLSIIHRPGYEAGESSAAAATRPIKEDIGYGIRDAWIDPRDIAEEEALTTLEGVNTRVTELAAVQEQDTQDIYRVMEDAQGRQTELFPRVKTLVDDSRYHYETGRLVDQEARCSREAWAHSIGLSSAVHFEL
nr:hypothetical protein [Tanacetum cinerariifolium]